MIVCLFVCLIDVCLIAAQVELLDLMRMCQVHEFPENAAIVLAPLPHAHAHRLRRLEDRCRISVWVCFPLVRAGGLGATSEPRGL